MSREVHIALYYDKQQEVFLQYAHGNCLCRCNKCTKAFDVSIETKLVWQRDNYIHKSTAWRRYRAMATHTDPEQRVCKFQTVVAHFTR